MKSSPINRILYVGFLLLGLYQALISKDFTQGAASLGKRRIYGFLILQWQAF
jgi:hypothetical protein